MGRKRARLPALFVFQSRILKVTLDCNHEKVLREVGI